MKSYLTLTGIDLQITLSLLKVKDKLELELDSNNLKLHYKPVSDNVIFDICDQNGKIYYSGNINEELTVCNIGEIAKVLTFLRKCKMIFLVSSSDSIMAM